VGERRLSDVSGCHSRLDDMLIHLYPAIKEVKCWNRLPREAVDAPSQTRLDGALGNPVKYQIWRLAGLPVAGWLEFEDPWSPFQPKPFYNSISCEGECHT